MFFRFYTVHSKQDMIKMAIKTKRITSIIANARIILLPIVFNTAQGYVQLMFQMCYFFQKHLL